MTWVGTGRLELRCRFNIRIQDYDFYLITNKNSKMNTIEDIPIPMPRKVKATINEIFSISGLNN